jgi:hypothetical protein
MSAAVHFSQARDVRPQRDAHGVAPARRVVEFHVSPGATPARRERQSSVEIRIGIANTGRELTFETSEPAETVRASVTGALDAGATHVWFADSKGNSYIIPTAGLAYVELGTEELRRVGFVG